MGDERDRLYQVIDQLSDEQVRYLLDFLAEAPPITADQRTMKNTPPGA